MKTIPSPLLVVLAATALSWSAKAQEVMVYQPPEVSGQFLFEPQTTAPAQPVFVSSTGVASAGPGTNSPVIATQNGTVFGAGTGVFDIGFDYIRPYWSYRDFTLVVPADQAGNFILGDTGNVDDHFGLAPTVRYNYVVTDAGLGIAASGKFLALSGRLQRQITTAAGTGTLNANSNLTIVTANLPELTQRIFLDEYFLEKHGKEWLADCVLDLSLGSRYSSVSQTYNSTLASGANISQRSSDQMFRGIGITSAAVFYCPFATSWLGYCSTRGSVLVGDNNKNSTMTVSVPAQPAANTSATINESQTQFIPVGEMEAGIMWGRSIRSSLFGETRPPVFTLKVGGVFQAWGDVGPLSAGSTQGFSSSDLFLVGVTIVGTVQY
ncbi:MAG: hypothetical protein U1D30_24135 [Planctomycetota bacterium]